MLKNKEQKIVVITGAGAGIGKATALNFFKNDYTVIVVDRDDKAGNKVVEMINKEGGQAIFINADVSKEHEIINMTEKIKKDFGTVDALVNNAGLFSNSGMKATVDEWLEVFQTNVVGYFLCAKYIYPLMMDKGGSIVNVASMSSFIAQEDYLLYNTTKGALINMARCMALDLGKYKIRVNNVCPGTVWTENNERYIKVSHNINKEEADLHPEFGGGNMLLRVSDPEEVASSIYFLASDNASFITAESLVVDGGYIAR